MKQYRVRVLLLESGELFAAAHECVLPLQLKFVCLALLRHA